MVTDCNPYYQAAVRGGRDSVAHRREVGYTVLVTLSNNGNAEFVVLSACLQLTLLSIPWLSHRATFVEFHLLHGREQPRLGHFPDASCSPTGQDPRGAADGKNAARHLSFMRERGLGRGFFWHMLIDWHERSWCATRPQVYNLGRSPSVTPGRRTRHHRSISHLKQQPPQCCPVPKRRDRPGTIPY